MKIPKSPFSKTIKNKLGAIQTTEQLVFSQKSNGNVASALAFFFADGNYISYLMGLSTGQFSLHFGVNLDSIQIWQRAFLRA